MLMFNAITLLSFALSANNVPAKLLLTFSCTHWSNQSGMQEGTWDIPNSAVSGLTRGAFLSPSVGNTGDDKSPQCHSVGKK